MSKGLEALHHPRIELAQIDISAEGKHDIAYMPFYKTKQYTAIENELKALEIFKTKIIGDLFLKLLNDMLASQRITYSEYDLLKETLL